MQMASLSDGSGKEGGREGGAEGGRARAHSESIISQISVTARHDRPRPRPQPRQQFTFARLPVGPIRKRKARPGRGTICSEHEIVGWQNYTVTPKCCETAITSLVQRGTSPEFELLRPPFASPVITARAPEIAVCSTLYPMGGERERERAMGKGCVRMGEK